MTHEMEMTERALVRLTHDAILLCGYVLSTGKAVIIELLNPAEDVKAYARAFGRVHATVPTVHHLTFDHGLSTIIVHTSK